MLPSYYEALRPLPDDMRLQLYDAIFDYAFRGTEPEGLSPVLNGYFALLRPNLDSSIKHYAASVGNGKKGGRPKKKPDNNPAITQQKPGGNREKEKEREKDMEMESDAADKPAPKRNKFTPPTVEQVTAYCKERNNGIDAERFISYYEARGWKLGNTPMKSWQAAVRTWEKNKKGNENKKAAEQDYSAPPGFDFI